MPRHDFICPTCREVREDVVISIREFELNSYPSCHGAMEILYRKSPIAGTWSEKDKVVVYENPQTGEIAYPGRNDVPMPDRYAKRGFEPKELRSLAQVTAFEKKHKVVNEAMHFDRNGRGFE